jgi:hypothetical protein
MIPCAHARAAMLETYSVVIRAGRNLTQGVF